MRLKSSIQIAASHGSSVAGPGRGVMAFTLLELLVVIGIIGIITGLSLKTIGNLVKPQGTGVALRQVLDDLAYARSLALSTRSTVYVVMMPTNLSIFTNTFYYPQYSTNQLKQLTNMISLQHRAYALCQLRSIGDQPGQSHPQYLTEWKVLPDQVFFPPQALDNTSSNANTFSRSTFRFPDVESPAWTLHYIAFNPQGQLVYRDASGNEVVTQTDARVPLTEGAIFSVKNPDDTYLVADPEIHETPPGRHTNIINRVTINWVTGRGRIETPQLQ